MKKFIIIFVCLILVGAFAYIVVTAKKGNTQTPISGKKFVEIAESNNFKVERLIGDKDTAIGINEKYHATITIDATSNAEIYFFVMNNVESAKKSFYTFYDEYSKGTYMIEYGFENSSGMFGNSQDFTFSDASKTIKLIRVDNIFASAIVKGYVPQVDSLFSQMGYKFTLDR